MFGKQLEDIQDPAVLPFLSHDALMRLYAASTERRHIHYSPDEAMVVGTPVLYRRGSLADTIVEGADLAGVCASTSEMRDKAQRLLAGDHALATAIRGDQRRIAASFGIDIARRQWGEVLGRISEQVQVKC